MEEPFEAIKDMEERYKFRRRATHEVAEKSFDGDEASVQLLDGASIGRLRQIFPVSNACDSSNTKQPLNRATD